VQGSRLNLGCGPRPLAGFVNVDLLEGPGVDVVADISGSLPFGDGEATLIYASHVLEHLPTLQVPVVLREWRRVLRDGGLLLVAVPDLDRISQLLQSRSGWFVPPHEPWIGAVYGGQKDELDFHKTGFTGPSLAALLDDAGFGAIERVGRFDEIGANDGSWSPFPFGVNISLNMRSVAGGKRVPAELLAREPFNVIFDAIDHSLTFALRGSALLRARLMERRRRRLEQTIDPSTRRTAPRGGG
jgi:SAM-dependent methyltransferase